MECSIKMLPRLPLLLRGGRGWEGRFDSAQRTNAPWAESTGDGRSLSGVEGPTIIKDVEILMD